MQCCGCLSVIRLPRNTDLISPLPEESVPKSLSAFDQNMDPPRGSVGFRTVLCYKIAFISGTVAVHSRKLRDSFNIDPYVFDFHLDFLAVVTAVTDNYAFVTPDLNSVQVRPYHVLSLHNVPRFLSALQGLNMIKDPAGLAKWFVAET